MATKYTRQDFYKHPEFKMVFGKSIVTPTGRLTWPSIIKPKPAPEPKPGQQKGADRYQITLNLAKDDSNVKIFLKELKAMTDVMLELFNDGANGQLSGLKLLGKYGDGDESDTEKYPFDENCWKLLARNKDRPQLLDRAKDALDPEDILGGLIGRLQVQPLITAAGGISYKVEKVQVIRDDGKRFAGGGASQEDLLDACSDDDSSKSSKDEEALDEGEDDAPVQKKKKTKTIEVEVEDDETEVEEKPKKKQGREAVKDLI